MDPSCLIWLQYTVTVTVLPVYRSSAYSAEQMHAGSVLLACAEALWPVKSILRCSFTLKVMHSIVAAQISEFYEFNLKVMNSRFSWVFAVCFILKLF